jgi:hypothetical protein
VANELAEGITVEKASRLAPPRRLENQKATAAAILGPNVMRHAGPISGESGALPFGFRPTHRRSPESDATPTIHRLAP